MRLFLSEDSLAQLVNFLYCEIPVEQNKVCELPRSYLSPVGKAESSGGIARGYLCKSRQRGARPALHVPDALVHGEQRAGKRTGREIGSAVSSHAVKAEKPEGLQLAVLDLQRIRNQDEAVLADDFIEGLYGVRANVNSVTDHFAVEAVEVHCGGHDAGVAVMMARHCIMGMGGVRKACGDGSFHVGKGGIGMTKKELSQLYYLNREIERDKERLDRLRMLASSPSGPNLTGMPSGSSFDNRLERLCAEIIDLEAIISAKVTQCVHERNRLERYIADIPDSFIRQIFQLRFVNGLNWQQVAASIGNNTADSVRMACNRYIAKTNAEENAEK